MQKKEADEMQQQPILIQGAMPVEVAALREALELSLIHISTRPPSALARSISTWVRSLAWAFS